MDSKAAKLRTLIVLFVFLALTVPWKNLSAQVVKIRLVNGKSGRPIASTCVNTWVGTERKDAITIPTDNEGVAKLYLTDRDAQVNIQSQPRNCGNFGVSDPVVKYADTIRIVAGYVVCQSHAPDYSWLSTMEFSMRKILQQGIVTANTCGKAAASPEPGELVIFVRPLSWWEKLKQ
ncbi:MAG: hypothetical protein WBX38_14075 [Candidatus Sulfotelmatobacter sp.]